MIKVRLRLRSLGQGAGLAWGMLFGILAALAGGPAGAGERLEVNALEYPWSAIGRLNVSTTTSRGHCSGTLIGERLVLTASHCVHDLAYNRWRTPSELHFLAGYQRGEHPLHSAVKSVIHADDFIDAKHPELKETYKDWAVLELVEPLGRQAGWLAVEPPTPQVMRAMHRDKAPVVVAGYRADRAHLITIDRDCALKGFYQTLPLLIHTCNVLHGDSGAPLMIFLGGEFRVIGIHVVTIRTPNGDLGGAVAASVLTDEPRWPKAVPAVAGLGLKLPSEGRGPAAGGLAAPLPAVSIANLLQVKPGANPEPAIRAFEASAGLPVTGQPSLALLGLLIRPPPKPAAATAP